MQQLTEYLQDYAPKLEKFIREYFNTQKQHVKNIDPFLTDCLNYLETYLLEGKKIRGALTILGYQINNSADVDKVLSVSAAIELIHSGLLIQDDFIDQDSMRRGIKSIHELYAARKDPHFGASMAVVIGDLGYFQAYQIVADSDFKSELIVKTLFELSRRLVNTGYGEILDVVSDNQIQLSQEGLDKAKIYKTAHYSFVMPLSIGAILAQASNNQFEAIENYGTEVGLAFQMQDDILGVVSDEKITGKSNISDIKSGKQTHILKKTLELATPTDLKFVKNHYGKSNLTDIQINRIKNIMQSCGAIATCQKLAQEHADQAKTYLSEITTNLEVSTILSQLTDFVVLRNK